MAASRGTSRAAGSCARSLRPALRVTRRGAPRPAGAAGIAVRRRCAPARPRRGTRSAASSRRPARRSRSARVAGEHRVAGERAGRDQLVDERETDLGTVGHRDRDRAVQRDDGRGHPRRTARRRARRSAPSRCRPRRGAVTWHRAIAACTWYGPGRRRRARRVEQRDALGDLAPGPTAPGPAPRAARGRRARRRGRPAGRRAAASARAARPPRARRASASTSAPTEPDRLVGQLAAHDVGARRSRGSPR